MCNIQPQYFVSFSLLSEIDFLNEKNRNLSQEASSNVSILFRLVLISLKNNFSDFFADAELL